MVTREVSRAVERLGLPGARLLVAVSGGVDSVALLHALHAISSRHGLKLSVGHVNHGLRGEESEADARFVGALAASLGLAFGVRAVEPGAARLGRSSRARPTLQEAARLLRYAALRELAEEGGAAAVATAHNADDQAETVLLRLLRGSGPDGLAGIPERSADGRVVRPLLRVPRAEILAFARGRGLAWREDASNLSDRYPRNRLRRRWLPELAREFNPRLLRALSDLAEAQRRDSEWMGALVEREAAARLAPEAGWLRIAAGGIEGLPEGLARRVARAALARCGAGREATRVHLERMLRFLCAGRPGTRLELPGGLKLVRDSGGFRLGPLPEPGRAPRAARGTAGPPPEGAC
jgi:tRNA(Ile)-lysidine synthase